MHTHAHIIWGTHQDMMLSLGHFFEDIIILLLYVNDVVRYSDNVITMQHFDILEMVY